MSGEDTESSSSPTSPKELKVHLYRWSDFHPLSGLLMTNANPTRYWEWWKETRFFSRFPSNLLFSLTSQRKFHDVRVIEFEGIDVDGAPLLEGFPRSLRSRSFLFSVLALVSFLSSLPRSLSRFSNSLSLELFDPIIFRQAQWYVFQPFLHFLSQFEISSEQPSYSVRIYGNRTLVIILSEMTTHFPAEAMDDIITAIFDFAHRHRCPVPHLFILPISFPLGLRLLSFFLFYVWI